MNRFTKTVFYKYIYCFYSLSRSTFHRDFSQVNNTKTFNSKYCADITMNQTSDLVSWNLFNYCSIETCCLNIFCNEVRTTLTRRCNYLKCCLKIHNIIKGILEVNNYALSADSANWPQKSDRGYKLHITKTYRICGHIGSHTVPMNSEPLEFHFPFYPVFFSFFFPFSVCCIRPLFLIDSFLYRFD